MVGCRRPEGSPLDLNHLPEDYTRDGKQVYEDTSTSGNINYFLLFFPIFNYSFYTGNANYLISHFSLLKRTGYLDKNNFLSNFMYGKV